MRRRFLPLGILVLAACWFGPLPELARHSFAAHMALHMSVVAVAAPLLALGLTGSRWDPALAAPWLFAAIPASILELVAVWAWHAPALHHAARQGGWPFAAEQATFLGAGFLLWMAAVGGEEGGRRHRAGPGVAALLFTSMHMTLLGALFALAPRSLYGHAETGMTGLSPLVDQHVGGLIMLLVGGLSYLAGGLWLTAGILQRPWRESRHPS